MIDQRKVYFIIEGEHYGGYVVWETAYQTIEAAREAVQRRVLLLNEKTFDKYVEDSHTEWGNGTYYLHINTLQVENK